MKRLAVLVSGKGSNLRAIMTACADGLLDASVELVISNNGNSLALATAAAANIKTAHISAQIYPDMDELDEATLNNLNRSQVDLVLLAGFMKKIGSRVLAAYRGRIINIHPSLLPKFGGQGMCGLNVHRAVLEAGESVSGATVHLVDKEYDKGEILSQETVAVYPDDTPEQLADRVLEVEHRIFAETIQKIIDGSIILTGNSQFA